MSYSFTDSETNTFSITHAKKIGAKVATDLKRMQRFYSEPSDYMINKYEEEIVQFLNDGYLKKVSYGFQKNGVWIEPSLHYEAKDLGGMSSSDDDPGRIRPGANISGGRFCSYLINNEKWWELNDEERISFSKSLPFTRSGANEPGVDGYLSQDKIYSSGGKAIIRSVVKKF